MILFRSEEYCLLDIPNYKVNEKNNLNGTGNRQWFSLISAQHGVAIDLYPNFCFLHPQNFQNWRA